MNRYAAAALFAITAAAAHARAADLVAVQPVTHAVLMLRFDDGHIDYYGSNQTYTGNIVYAAPLNVATALNTNTYLISSPDDPAYAAGHRPVATGRKAKGMDFNNPWSGVRFLQDHWVYLALPAPLQRGKTYTLALGGAAGNRSSFTFVFDEYTLRSDTIHVNQIGFTPDAPKYAYLSHWMGSFSNGVHRSSLNLDSLSGSVFHVYDVHLRSNVFSAPIARRKQKTQPDSANASDYGATRNYTYADVWECDFSSLTNSGTYMIVAENIGCSYQFEIAPDVYRQAFHTAMRGLFFQRQGIVKEIEPGLNYPRSHHPDDKKWYYDPNFKFWKNSNHGLPGFSYTRQVTNIWGYYFDAGDWDGYPSHLVVPLGLMTLYDLRPDRFADGDVGNRYKLAASDPAWIDEGSDGLPDVLNEAVWLIAYCRRARQQLMAQGYGSGGVPDYTGRDAGADHPSWTDTRAWALTAESPDATYMYAGGAAYYACMLDECHNRTHPGQRHPDSPAWQAEAEAAYAWAAAYIATNPADNTAEIERAKAVACAALYRLTTNAAHQAAMRAIIEADSERNTPVWITPSRIHFAAFIYLLLTYADYPNLDLGYYSTLGNRYVTMANNNEASATGAASTGNGLRVVIDDYRSYMLGTFSSPRIYVSAVAHALTGQKKHLDTAHHAAAYALGGNEMNMVHMTGIGDNPERFAFHPDSWFLLDYSSKVYVNPPLPGYVLYAGDMTSWVGGIGDERWSHSSCWPNFITNWPRSEGRIFNRNSINSSEFTVPQSQLPMAFTLGFLCGVPHGPYTPPARPVVSLNLSDGQAAPAYGVLPLTVTACSNTARVEYFYEWHYIGESTARSNAFRCDWFVELTSGQTVLVTARAFDDKGTMSVPLDAAGKTVEIIPEPAVAAGALLLMLGARSPAAHVSP